MKKSIIILSVLLIFSNIAVGQLLIDWQQCFGGSENDIAHDIVQTEGGYLVAGHTVSNDGDISFNHGGGDYWIVKIDNNGNLLWEKTYGGTSSEGATRILNSTVSNDSFIVGGTNSIDGDISNNPYPGTGNLWVVKIDSSGNIIWDRVLGNTIGVLPGDEYGISTNDGGLVITGQIDSQGGDITTWYGGYDGWLIKLDSAGHIEWDFTMGSSQFEFINTIIQTGDDGYLAGLYGEPNGVGGNIDCRVPSTNRSDAILFKLDADGNGQWSRCYGGRGHDAVQSLLEVENGYMINATGGSGDGDQEGSGYHGGYDIWLVKTDFSGNIIWQKCYGGSNGFYFTFSIHSTVYVIFFTKK